MWMTFCHWKTSERKKGKNFRLHYIHQNWHGISLMVKENK